MSLRKNRLLIPIYPISFNPACYKLPSIKDFKTKATGNGAGNNTNTNNNLTTFYYLTWLSARANCGMVHTDTGKDSEKRMESTSGNRTRAERQK